jgi:hypothetical protein
MIRLTATFSPVGYLILSADLIRYEIGPLRGRPSSRVLCRLSIESYSSVCDAPMRLTATQKVHNSAVLRHPNVAFLLHATEACMARPVVVAEAR